VKATTKTCLKNHAVWLGAMALVFWLGALLWTGGLLLDHAYRPAKIPSDISEVVVQPRPGDAAGFHILLFAHPFCPCTRATLSELEESVARLPADVSVNVVFVTRGLTQPEVEASSIVGQARGMSRVNVHFDTTGLEAQRFGATVSGEVFALDAAGRVVFHGGLTPARGHQGDSAGQTALEQLARGMTPTTTTAPTFGCRLPTG